MLTLFIIFILGLLIGSFLNVVIFRMNELHTIILTRSHCQECKKEIAWYDLIPFLSFIILKTKCRYCDKPISWQYPLVEVGTAILSVLIYWKFGNHLYTYFLLATTYFLIVIFVYDLKKYLIPDEMLYPAIIIAIIYRAFDSPLNFKMTLLGVLIAVGFLGIIYLLGKGKWMGFGDVKLAILLGLVTPFPLVIITIFLAFLIGSVVGLIMVSLKQKKLKSEVPFAPFLIIGLYLSIFFGEKIISWYFGIV